MGYCGKECTLKCKFLIIGGIDIAQLLAIVFYLYFTYLLIRFLVFMFKLFCEISICSDGVRIFKQLI